MRPMKVFLTGLLLSGLLGSAESFGTAASSTVRTDSGGGVTVKITFLDPKASSDLRFQVVLNTHSVDLDGYDLKTLSILRDDMGKDYVPMRAENKGSGHHREITLIFSKIAPESKRIEIVIRDIAGIKERTFRWNLE